MTPDEFYRTLAHNIRRVRQARGMSPSALSEAIGKPKNYIGNLELGGMRISTHLTIKIAEALGCSLEELMNENHS